MRRFLPFLLLPLLALSLAGCGARGRSASGQTGWLTGEIRDAETGMLIEAQVAVDGTVYPTVGGRYRTAPLNYGSHEVVVSAAGYAAQGSSVNLNRSPYSLSFRLGRQPDLVPPQVTGFYPAPGATGVYRDTSLVFTFSEEMDPGKTEKALAISPAVGYEVAWEDDFHLVVTPTTLLSGGQRYVVTLGAEARDRAGNALSPPFTANFTTGSDLTPKSRIAYVSDGATGRPQLFVKGPNPGAPSTALFADALEDAEPSWSPDGKRLVFSSRRGVSARMQLYTTRVDAPVALALSTGSEEDVQPKWSPDGSRIAFLSYRDFMRTADLWVVNVDETGQAVSGTVKQVTGDPAMGYQSGPSDIASPEWSPDGTLLAFSSTRFAGEHDLPRRLYAVDVQDLGGAVGELAGRPVSELTPDGVGEDFPAWWSDGVPGSVQRIAYASFRQEDGETVPDWDLWVMDVTVTSDAFGNRSVVAENHTRLTHTPGINETSPVWSPDGRYLLFVRETGSTVDLYQLSVDSPELPPVPVVNGSGKEYSPAWSRQ